MVSPWIDVRPTPSPFILSLALARARERSRRGLVRRSDGLHLAVARQRKDACPWQGEAGAQRRVRVDAVVVHRRSTHSLTFHPLPRPSQGEGEESTSLGATEVTVCTSQLHGREKTPLPARERPARSAG